MAGSAANNTNNTLKSLLKLFTLLAIAGAAISSRLFSVIRHESIIHEFDPWFNLWVASVI